MAIPTDDERDAAAPESAAPDRWDAILPQEPRRFVLVHYHIFKNGGSTIEYVLERAFPGRFATVHGPSPDSVLTGEDLAAFIRANPHLTAITSHHLRYPLPAMKDVVIFDICLLRDPIDR